MRVPQKIVSILQEGGVGVLPTDTVYGYVGQALNRGTVGRVYRARKKDSKRPLIILISSVEDLKLFGISIRPGERRMLSRLWEKPVSVILPARNKKFSYLHRGTKTLAFRLPRQAWLRSLIRKTTPLVAPSANPPKLPTARTIREAKKYFGDTVDFYIDGGVMKGKASTIVRLEKGVISVQREGVVSAKFIERIMN